MHPPFGTISTPSLCSFGSDVVRKALLRLYSTQPNLKQNSGLQAVQFLSFRFWGSIPRPPAPQQLIDTNIHPKKTHGTTFEMDPKVFNFLLKLPYTTTQKVHVDCQYGIRSTSHIWYGFWALIPYWHSKWTL